MGLKSSLKRNDWLRRKVKQAKILREYAADARFMNSHLLDGGNTKNHLAYRVMLRVHSLEKGLVNRAPRAFGAAKVRDLVAMLEESPDDFRSTTAFHMGLQVLQAWLDFNEKNSWGDPAVVEYAQSFLESSPASDPLGRRAGAKSIDERDPDRWVDLPFPEFIGSRHSTRRYSSSLTVDDESIQECVELALLSPSACNRQMVRLRVIDDPEAKRVLFDTLHGTGGIDYDTCRMAVVTFDSESLEFYGERNQGYLNAGLFAMTLVYAFHWKGIGSCLLQFGNTFSEERKLVDALGLHPSERIAVGLSIGVLENTDLVPASVRRTVGEVLSF